MFDLIAYSPLGFWAVACLIVLADSVVLLSPGEFTFRFAAGAKVRLRANPYPFLLLRRELVFTLVNYPGVPFLISSMQAPELTRRSFVSLLLVCQRTAVRCRSLSALSWSGIVLLCVVGPILSLQYGVEFSIVAIWLPMYALALLVIAIVYRNRRELGFDAADLIGIGLEYLVCPFLLVNTWKKVALRRTHAFHPVLLARYCTADPTAALRNLESNLAEKQGAERRVE